MAFNIMPQFKLPGEILAETPKEMSGIMERILQGKQNQQKIEQDRIANEQLNQYRMGELGLRREELPSQVALRKAQAKYYNTGIGAGGRGVGVDIQKQRGLMQQIIADNPGMTTEKANEVSNAYLEGKTILSNGEPVPPMSGKSRALVSSIAGGETTTALFNQRVQAEQAEAELPVYDKYINEGVQPYGTTIFGKSPQQIKDSVMVNDHKAQERLGKYLASQQLLYDRAALTLRINSLPAGVKIADEIKKLSFQSINEKFPRMSAEARKIASETVAKALLEGFEARKKVSISKSSIYNKNEKPKESTQQSNEEPTQKREVWTKDAKGNPILVNK